ncbi:hypothetical protein CLOBY_00400 [Clostridium saccharobutylicum]|uniref:hypothetical protein n=1 Tax=Clostridium saccharobutylicum TaxID=169679 RepID=UPI000983A544|nr:hypothetical protein [Clostridium saccharobutylicum]AQS07991.1 hypothetical protein CLOBY_00400 [Clostridium saccharobutylicum]NSB89319.1 hypothetical protein [Clostridium saccharobutylicum]NYC29691.1 hypothetical protein [Clostridium saccharobutylicum]OOM17322.1 hypothetical protein CLSAB_17470 [Clostridium saccharobutylicum]
MKLEKAKYLIKKLMKEQKYKYDYINYIDSQGLPVDITQADTLHYSFCEISYINELQLSITFKTNHFEVLIFPDPILIDIENKDSAIFLINYINNYIKIGRFYIDTKSFDIVWRGNNISYEILEAFPNEIIEESIISGISYFIDISYSLSKLIKGEFNIKEACGYIDAVWDII